MITNKVGKVMAIIICTIFVLIMGTILYLFFKEDQVFTKEGLHMVNIVDKAKETDGDKFIHYKVEGVSKDSKELIAVHFNTNSENNIGFIDEYRNVVKELFLSDPYYDYYETAGVSTWLSYYVGEYYEDIYSESYYNRNFEKV